MRFLVALAFCVVTLSLRATTFVVTTFPGSVPFAKVVTATATFTNANTSEFSFCHDIVVPPPVYIRRDAGGTITVFWSGSCNEAPHLLQKSGSTIPIQSLSSAMNTSSPNPPPPAIISAFVHPDSRFILVLDFR
jgi:hypothetical protein